MVQRGEIYWVDLGQVKGSALRGPHPVLIVQNDVGNASSPTTIVAGMTSQPKRHYPFHVDIMGDECGLKKDGTILLEQLQTLDIAELGPCAGRLPASRMAEVDKALRVSLGLM